MAAKERLTDREKEVLKYVVENFIKSANPVGSRSVSKQTDLQLSSATIRNVMCDLEEMDLLGTPHTSAGRVPTDKGYRYYVDLLMERERINPEDELSIKARLEEANMTLTEKENLFAETSRILGKVAKLIAVVSEPIISQGIF
ncbi:MAG: HrcA family transcriptional regulator, partial [Ignavibacteria bacterium]|nr:HrcA family transcriptional regulator [Ignavibacteria bacterium]